MSLLKRLDLPPLWGALFGAAIWLTAHAMLLPLPGAAIWVGRALIALGLALVLWSAWWFWRKRTPIEPRHTPRALIDDGPFRYVRNPIYRALVLVLAGWTFACGDAAGFIFVAAYEWLLRRRFVAPEEAVLQRTFPEAWRAWAARTPRRM
jgi:protein-S-isoprenylcysteine O-methyltransferase Ste14